MGRAKGTPKTGGRKAGTPNKTTTDIKTWVANILDGGRDEFASRLASLDDVPHNPRGNNEEREGNDARVAFVYARTND